jgi:ribonuclease HI
MAQTLFINTDGGSRRNPGHAATGYVIKDDAGNVLELCGNYIGIQTNNVAEYQAVLHAYQKIKERWGSEVGGLTLKFYTDSQLVVNQLQGSFRIKNEGLKKLISQIKQLEGEFKDVQYHYVPRAQNSEADSLVNKALDERIA